jgi:uncharacterized protein
MLQNMRFTADSAQGNSIRSYQPGEICLQNQTICTHAIISRDQLILDWQPPAINELSIADFQIALDLQPDIILFGTGIRQQFPDIRLMTEIMRTGVAIEIMETRSACTTFNVLVSENRAVVAALLVA